MSARGGEAVDEDPDRDLVRQARRGDERAFAVLVRRYQGRVVAAVRGLIRNPADAEDVAQEVFLRVFKSLDQFRGRSTFRTWLYRIATNTARTHSSRTRARAEVSGHDDRHDDSLFDRTATPGDLERATIARDRVERALAALPQEWREVIVLRDLEGLDYREIAEALDIPLGTVESRIFRGRVRLRRALTGEDLAEDTGHD